MIPTLQYGLLALFALNLALWLLCMRQHYTRPTATSLDVAGQRGPSPAIEIFRGIGALILGLVMIGSVSPIGASDALDPSWQMVLEHATFKKLVNGRDIVFTFGPLAPVSTDLSNGAGHFHSERLAYTLWLGSVFVVCWWRLSLQLPRPLVVLSWIWLVLLPGDAVSYAAIVLLAWAMKPQQQNTLTGWLLTILAAPVGLAVLGAVKFTYTVAAIAVIAAWVGHAALFLRSWKLALLPILSATAAFVFVWMAAPQPLEAIPQWFMWGLLVSSAYAEAMQVITVSPLALWLAAGTVILAMVLLSSLALWRGWKRHTADLILALVCLGLLAIVWKHSVTRADGHLTMIGSLAPLLCCLALSSQRSASLPWSFGVTSLTTVVILMFGALASRFAITGSAFETSALAHSFGLAPNNQQVLPILTASARPLPDALLNAAGLASTRVPTFKALVKDEPVDVFNFRQSAAFASGLNYQPRPVFQSYQACDEKLMAINETYWKARISTHHLVCRVESVDGRLSSSDDAACWPHWLTNLAPAAVESDFVLLSPSGEQTNTPHWSPLNSGEAEFGTSLPVPSPPPGTLLRLRATIQRSLRGKLVKAAFQPDAVRMTTLMADGTNEITRVVPGALALGVLITPFINNNVDLLASYAQDSALQRKPASLTLTAERGRHREFAPRFQYVWETCAAPVIPPATTEKSRKLLLQARLPDPGRAPDLLGGSLPGEVMQLSLKSLIIADFDGRPALRLDAPSKVVIQNDRRGGRLEVSYMVPDKSWKRKKPTDGVRFIIATAGHDGKENIVLDHFLDPGKVESDREKKTFSVTLPPNDAPWLILRTGTGPTDYQDRAIWGDFTWTPATDDKR